MAIWPNRWKRGLITGAIASVALTTALAACGSSSSSSTVLHFPVFQDPGTWDPGQADAEVDTELSQNVFDNLWRFDDSLNIVPDIAKAVPTQANGGISADGKTFTVHLNSNVVFSNGDKVTSKDVLYSFNRAVALQGAYASNLTPIAGSAAVQAAAGTSPGSKGSATSKASFAQNIENHLASGDKTFMMSGLTAPDPNTVVITTTNPCGYCLTAWTLEGSTGAIVDQNVIKNDPINWWSKPSELIGTGAYTLSSYTAKQSIVFKVVPNWWGASDGASTPTLTEIDLDIKDPSYASSAVTAWEQGNYDIVGYGGNSSNIPLTDIKRIQGNSSESGQLSTVPKGRTTWLSFNWGYPSTGGPFQGNGAAAVGLRTAFALAIDKSALVSTVCSNLLCAPATGGLITKGLIGYGGDNSDPLGKFNAAQAKALLAQYDPTGQLTAGMTYSYNSGGLNDGTATNLQDQWKTNLGVNVKLDPHPDASAFINDRLSGKYVMSRDGWQFDYNHPQDWYDNLWGNLATTAGANTSGYDTPTYDSTLAQADTLPISQALPLYTKLSQELETNAVYIPLYYSVANFLIRSNVHGAGSNAAFDHYWDEISLS